MLLQYEYIISSHEHFRHADYFLNSLSNTKKIRVQSRLTFFHELEHLPSRICVQMKSKWSTLSNATGELDNQNYFTKERANTL